MQVALVAVILAAYQVDSLSLPYPGPCQNPKTEYNVGDTCCSRCPPGSKLKVRCNETADSVCEPCPRRQYTGGWNYKRQCSSCPECKESRGMQYLQHCTANTTSMCGCKPGWFCTLGYKDPHCETECYKYKLCKPGHGVLKQGTAESNVVCSICKDGTFSDEDSYTQSCKPHTRCQEAVVKQGNATSDTVCELTAYTTTTQSPTTETQSPVVYTPISLLNASIPTKPNLSSEPVIVKSNYPTEPPVSPNVTLVTAIVIGCVFLIIIIIILVVLWKSKIINRKDTNGNCETVDSMQLELTWLMENQKPGTGVSNAPNKPLAGMGDPRGMEHVSLV